MDLTCLANKIAKLAFNDEPVILSNVKTLPGNSSLVYRFEYIFRGFQKAVFVKLPTGQGEFPEKAERLKREYKITECVKAAFPDLMDLHTVSPVGFIQDVCAFVTWEIPGTSLQEKINSGLRLRPPGGLYDLTKYAEMAGRWLRQFHGLGVNHEKLDLNRHFDYCTKRVEILLEHKHGGLSHDLAVALKATLSTWINTISANVNGQETLCHNDYSPHNIIVSEDRLYVLDYSFSAPGLPIFDVACFWHKLEDLKASPFYLNKTVEEIQNGFLGACQIEFNLHQPEVKLALMRLVLSKMLSLCEVSTLRPGLWMENKRRYSGYLEFLRSHV
jgi:aminoglycoside phosphotransferase (APT) family kinase protein